MSLDDRRGPTEGVGPISTVSVIVPYFNGKKWLPRALTSIRRQTRVPLEVIIVDDGSAEPLTTEEAREYLSPIEARVIRHPINRGIPAARNTGIADAKGEWIAFLDQDDEWLPDRLERETSLASHERKIVFGTVFQEIGSRRLPPSKQLIRLAQHLASLQTGVERCSFLLTHGNFVSWITLLVHRDVIQSVGMLDEQLLGGTDDYDFVLRAAWEYPLTFAGDSPVAVHYTTGQNYSNIERFHRDHLILARKLIRIHPELQPWQGALLARSFLDVGSNRIRQGYLLEGVATMAEVVRRYPRQSLPLLLQKIWNRAAARYRKGNRRTGLRGADGDQGLVT